MAEAAKLTHTGSWDWDVRAQKVLYCSAEMFRIFGLDPAESLPTRKNFRQRVHPEDRDWVDKRFERSLREKVDSFDEYRVLVPDGTVKHINSSGHPILDEDGEVIEFIATAVDVTERKRAELERRHLASLVEQAGDLMAIADLSGGTPIYLNKAGMKMVGFDSWEEARERRGIHYMFPEDRQFVNEILWPTVLEKGSWSGEMRFRHFKTGDPIPVLYSCFRIDDPETGQPVNVGNVCRDITERKRAEAEARESDRRYHEMQIELAHANRVATVGQPRPRSPMKSFSQSPRRSQTPRLLCAFLLGIIASKGGAGGAHQHRRRWRPRSRGDQRIRALMKKTPPRKDRLEVSEVILEIIELTRGAAVKHGVSILTELADPLPVVEADRVQLQQVLLNLIVNALEAMGADNEGPKELLISTEKVEASGVLVAVQDWGPGLEPAMLERVFEFSTRRSRPVWGSASQSAVRSSRRMAGAFGRARTSRVALPFNLCFLAMQTFYPDRKPSLPSS